MDDRTLTPDDLEKLLFHADRIGLVSYVSGMTPGWMPAMRGITYTEAVEAFAHFRDNGPPGTALFIRPHDVRKRVLSKRSPIPYHLECQDHPGQYAYECRDCKRMIEPPSTKVIEDVKALARKAHINARTRDQDRAAALQARADESARRAAEKLEKRRQLAAYRSKEDA